MFIIIVHELGHFLTAKLFNWKVLKINIYPLGGLTVYNDNINKPFFESFLVSIMGPVFQVIFVWLIFRNNEDIIFFNNLFLLFNLLPIVPLDGSKMLSLFLELFFPYKVVMSFLVFFSFFICFIILICLMPYYKSLLFIIIFLSLLFKIFDEKNKVNYYYNKFLIERYVYHFYFSKCSFVSDIYSFYKFRENMNKHNNMILSEKDLLKSYFEYHGIVKKRKK